MRNRLVASAINFPSEKTVLDGLPAEGLERSRLSSIFVIIIALQLYKHEGAYFVYEK